jgi:hypothetical protein
MKIVDKLVTYYRLGLINLCRVGFYKLWLKLNIHPVQKISFEPFNGIFFKQPEISLPYGSSSLESIKSGFNPFSGDFISFENEHPDWHKNYFNAQQSKFKNYNWWDIPDFDSALGDIKTVWELSRFDWVIQLVILSISGDKDAITILNNRLNHWLKENLPYKGVNWKCGQEASIRVMHLIFSAIIIEQFNKPSQSLLKMIEMHIKRIAPTISYAIGQNNNHGTSEAAALFIGGHFLKINGFLQYEKYEKIGRKWLEERSKTLFSEDGCFSQFSTNYHRVALDTYSFCETYRRYNNLKPFSRELNDKLAKATRWLEVLTDKNSGDVPNMGANDGAKLFPTFKSEYRDYRRSVQWANIVFYNRLIYVLTENEKFIFNKLGIKTASANKDLPLDNILLKGNEDGFFIYRNKSVLLVFKRPIFNFRPSQSDAMHIDLWIGGQNVLRDGGSYSYNSSFDKSNYYNGVASHNTVQFDGRNQMPRFSRFLFGSWLKEKCFIQNYNENELSIKAGYLDYMGANHYRSIILKKGELCILDDISGFKKSAVLRWRLNLSNWILVEDFLGDSIEFDLKRNLIKGKCNLGKGLESRYYHRENEISIILKNINNNSKFLTIFKFQ